MPGGESVGRKDEAKSHSHRRLALFKEWDI